jgi:hypothetical protein
MTTNGDKVRLWKEAVMANIDVVTGQSPEIRLKTKYVMRQTLSGWNDNAFSLTLSTTSARKLSIALGQLRDGQRTTLMAIEALNPHSYSKSYSVRPDECLLPVSVCLSVWATIQCSYEPLGC